MDVAAPEDVEDEAGNGEGDDQQGPGQLIVKRFDNPHKYYVDLSQRLWDVKHGLLEKNG